MKCLKCDNESVTDTSYLKPLCSNCFLKSLEKKIRKDIRTNNKIEKDDRLFVKDELSLHFIKRIISMPIKIVKEKPYKIVQLYTLDDKVSDFLSDFLLNKENKKDKADKTAKITKADRTDKAISIFEAITDKELEIFSLIKGLKFSPNPKDEKAQKFVELIYKRYPESRYGIAKSFDELSLMKLKNHDEN